VNKKVADLHAILVRRDKAMADWKKAILAKDNLIRKMQVSYFPIIFVGLIEQKLRCDVFEYIRHPV
jgi:hypothetical protein